MIKSLLLCALAIFLGVAHAQAQTTAAPAQNGYVTITGCPGTLTSCFVQNPGTVALGYQQIVGPATATSLTVPTGATEAVIRCTGAVVNYRDDNTTPTTALGMFLNVNDTLVEIGALNLSQFKMIQVTPTATCNVNYYK